MGAFGNLLLPTEKTALIIGAGGSARATVVALSQLGFKTIKIKGRDPEKVRSFIIEMEKNLSVQSTINYSAPVICPWINERGNNDQENCAQFDLVINASPIGQKNETAPEWLIQFITKLNDQCLCFDLVYGKNGSMPIFTNLASHRGLKAIDGLPMLIHQARYAFEFWTGISVAD